MKRSRRIRRVFFAVALVLAALYVFPFGLVILNSVKLRRDAANDPLALPKSPQWSNFTNAIEKMEFWQALANSFIVTITSVCAIIAASSLLAYYLSRTKSKFSTMTFLVLVDFYIGGILSFFHL